MADIETGRDVAVAPAFLSVMAHELSQPLAAALGSAQTLKRTSASGRLDAATRDQLFDTAIRNLEQLQSLLNSLRVFSEAESGNLTIATTSISVEDLFREAQEDFGTPASLTHVGFTADPGLRVDVDLMLFRQVLSNIIHNAAKFSPDGSIVTVEAHAHEDVALFTVSDEGGGFPPAESERIFGKTVRLQPGKKGLGVGLFVAKAIIQAHGGDIWAENISGGAKFSFTIPAS